MQIFTVYIWHKCAFICSSRHALAMVQHSPDLACQPQNVGFLTITTQKQLLLVMNAVSQMFRQKCGPSHCLAGLLL